MRILSIVAERLAYGIGLLVAVLVLNFFLIRLAPGDPVQFLIGEMGGASEEVVREIRASYGLDRPLLEQLGIYLTKAAQGDLGRSFYYNSPVIDLFLSRAGPTILLIATATVVSLVAGTVLGVLHELGMKLFDVVQCLLSHAVVDLVVVASEDADHVAL